MRNATLALILLAGLGARTAWSQGHQTRCPNVRASQVDVESQELGTPKTCGVGIVIFGVGGSIVGETCYPLIVTVPAHQTCLGEVNEGTYCAPDGRISVTARECHCGGLVLPFIQTGIPAKCVCDGDSDAGTVEDFETKECIGV